MFRTAFKIVTAIVALGFLVVALGPPAHATAQLTLTSGTASVVIVDDGARDIWSGLDNVTFVGNVGGWTYNLAAGMSKESAYPSLLHLTSANTAAPGAAPLRVEFWDDNFSPSVASLGLYVGGAGPGYGTLTFAAYLNDTRIGEVLTFEDPWDFSGHTGVVFPDGSGSPYALRQVATIDLEGQRGTLSFDTQIATPEPASIALFGAFLCATACVARRRARNHR